MTDHSTTEQIWDTSFTAEQRDEQVDADKEAWRGIIGILLAIVTMGVSLAAIIVWAITVFG